LIVGVCITGSCRLASSERRSSAVAFAQSARRNNDGEENAIPIGGAQYGWGVEGVDTDGGEGAIPKGGEGRRAETGKGEGAREGRGGGGG